MQSCQNKSCRLIYRKCVSEFIHCCLVCIIDVLQSAIILFAQYASHGLKTDGGIPIDRGSDRPIIEKGPLDRGPDRPIIEKGPIDRGPDRPIIEKGPIDRGSDRPIIWKGSYRQRV